MSYPPPGGYPPYQQQGPPGGPPGGPNLGFSANPQAGGPGQGPGYPLYPTAGASPYPPTGGIPGSYPPQNQSYPNMNQGTPYPPQGGGFPAPSSAPYPPQGSPYPGGPSPSGYPPAQGAPYAPNPGSSPYPPSPYPSGAPSGPSPYPQDPSSHQGVSSRTDYAASHGAPAPSPYPTGGSASPYPPQGGGYPPQGGGYPPQGGGYAPPGNPYPSASPYSAAGGPVGGYPGAHPGAAPASQLGGGMMYSYQERPTVKASQAFDPSSDAALLRKAMKGFGTDEKAIVAILGRRTSAQRQHILVKYQQAYGRDLSKDLASELGGRFEQVVLSLMLDQPIYLAKELNRAMKGIGTKEKVLIEVLCTRDNNTIRAIKGAYQMTFGHPLEKDISEDTSGDFGRLMISMCAGYRDETPPNPSLAPGLAQELYKAGEKKTGTDEGEFNRILSSYSYPMLRCVFEEYHKIKGKSFEAAIKSELSGDFQGGMLALYHTINNRASFFATELNNAMKGMGTHDDTLIRIVITRSEIDMGNIKEEYHRLYNKRLDDAIKSETSGDYKSVLLALVQD